MTDYKYKKILILGDSGRGKITFAEKLSKKISILHYSTDDFYYKVKFTEINDKKKSVEEIGRIYAQNEWIVEGTTRRLIQGGLETADVIYLLEFKNIIYQYYFIISRHFKRTNESLLGLWQQLKHVTRKKYKKEYANYMPSLHELLEPYKEKIIKFNFLKEINQHLESIK
jgi:adenylate kinase family enzyme